MYPPDHIAMRPAPTGHIAARADYADTHDALPDGALTGLGWECVQSGTIRSVWTIYDNGQRRGGIEAPARRSEGWLAEARTPTGPLDLGDTHHDAHAAANAVRRAIQPSATLAP
jgi:hypothetical protein